MFTQELILRFFANGTRAKLIGCIAEVLKRVSNLKDD